MQRSLKQFIRRRIHDSVVSIASVTAAGLSRFVPDPEAYEVFHRRGYHLVRRHYYTPIPDEGDLDERFWKTESQMIGIDMNEAGALRLLDDVFPLYMEEFRARFPLRAADGEGGFYVLNANFMAVDSHVYYALIRHLRPRRIVEIGGGFSTMLAAAACLENERCHGFAPRLTAIEPYPSAALQHGFAGLAELVQCKVQDVPLARFSELGANDILFIDSSHVLRAGGDVQHEFLEILPRLSPGVVVHVHDVSLPGPYPRVYFDERRFYWNEQYLLQAFLAFNNRFEVLWPGNYMTLRHGQRVTDIFPEYADMRAAFPSSEAASFWMRVRPE